MTHLVPSNIKLLPQLEGFPFNLLPSRPDQYAYEACCNVFGKKKVDDIQGVLHRSSMTYDEMLNDLLKYGRVHRPRKVDPVYDLILKSVSLDLQREEKIIPLTMGGVPARDDFPNSKSPGLPYKNMGIKTKREALLAGKLHEINRDWQLVGRGKHVHFPDVCLFARAQISRIGKNKIRATWGYPLSVYMEEGRFFYPLQDWIKSSDHSLPIAYGYEMAHGGMSHINSMLLANAGKNFVCTDWSGFDKTIPPWLIRDAFNILKGVYDFSRVRDAEGCVWDVDPKKTDLRWRAMVNYFVRTPIRTCKGTRFEVTGGVPSGSCFTNIIDSIINIIVSRWLVYNTTGALPDAEIYLGDDAVFVTRGHVNLSDYKSLAYDRFGMDLNVDKSYVTTRIDNVHFLGYFNFHGYPFKNQDYLIASFIHPEHTRQSVVEACAAALGQMWSSFDPGYSVHWFRIIQILQARERHSVSHRDIVLHLRNSAYRHKYLAHVGVDVSKITIPEPIDGSILDVLPRNCVVSRPSSEKDLRKIARS